MLSPTLIIGSKNYSSWSFRAWLVLTKLGIDFEEISIPLFTEGYKDQLLKYSPAGKVPVYLDGYFAIWDSLAISEYLAELHPQLWPKNREKRAYARSVVAEMHSSFTELRNTMPMNCRATGRFIDNTDTLITDINRIKTIWTDCRKMSTNDGPWLFGSFSIADAMYAPVVSRFHTYNVSCEGLISEYMNTVLNDTDVKKWYQEAKDEKQIIKNAEVGLIPNS